MSPESELEYYVENPDRLLDLCREVLERLDTGTGGEAAKQLQAVSAAIAQLQKQGIAVPDGLRAEKLRIADAQASHEASSGKFRDLVEGLDQLVRPHLGKIRGKQDQAGDFKIRRRSRDDADTTDKETFHRLIIEILRSFGGRAKVSEVLDEIERQMQCQFTPRDLEARIGGMLVWKNNAQWERLRMVKEGILRSDSPHGIWELNE